MAWSHHQKCHGRVGNGVQGPVWATLKMRLVLSAMFGIIYVNMNLIHHAFKLAIHLSFLKQKSLSNEYRYE